jgi:lipoate-protein ligase B
MSTLLFKNLGFLDYPRSLALQEELKELKQKKPLPDILLMVEHPHVFTLGRRGNADHVLRPEEIPVYRASRGGDVTYHGPGQAVFYPIIDLRSKLRKAVHRYLRRLETVAILVLHDFGIRPIRRPPWTGIWIDDRKIASIGIAVSRGITYHGLALNVNSDLRYFRRIVPCGLAWASVTSMAREGGKEWVLQEVQQRFLERLVQQFGYEGSKELCHGDIPTGLKPNFPGAPVTSNSSGF